LCNLLAGTPSWSITQQMWPRAKSEFEFCGHFEKNGGNFIYRCVKKSF
jgi:hypothetical protein